MKSPTVGYSTTMLVLQLLATVAAEDIPFPLPVDPATCAAVDAASTTAVTLNHNSEEGFTCLSVPDASGDDIQQAGLFKLTIIPSVIGRYELMHALPPADYDITDDNQYVSSGMGYAWTAPDTGLTYCVDAGTDIAFIEFVEGATLSVAVEWVPEDEACVSDTFIGDGGNNLLPDTGGDGDGSIEWSDTRYILKADYFGYTVAGEETVTLSDPVNLEVTGDPGGDDYMTIEVTWNDPSGRERRFYGYLESDGREWTMFEARVYDNSGEWVTFASGPPTSAEARGNRDECFQQESLVLSTFDENDRLSQIRFDNLTLLTFLPWSDQSAMEECTNRTSILPTPVDPGAPFTSSEGEVISSSSAVTWSTPRYFLHANHFEYTIEGKETETMVGSRDIAIGGDPGGDNYTTIEIFWLNDTDGSRKGFFGYFEANTTHWNMFEARVANSDTDDWEFFEGIGNILSGKHGDCLMQDELVIVNDRGSEIRFENLYLAVFLPFGVDDSQIEELEPAILEARSSFSNIDNVCSRLSERPIVATTTNGQSGESGNVDESAGVDVDADESIGADTIQTNTISAAKSLTHQLVKDVGVGLLTLIGLAALH